MANLTLYTHPMSRGRIARWMLEEVGQPYKMEIIQFGGSSDDYRAVNPMGKVPAIRHGDTIVTETAAICAYLADAFPEAGLAPSPSALARGDYYRWLFFTAGPLEAAVMDRALGLAEIPADRKLAVGYGSFDLTMDVLEKAVSAGPYLAGDRFSAADLYLASHLGWGMGFGTVPKRPAFEDYVARHYARPAHLRATELDDDAAKELGRGKA